MEENLKSIHSVNFHFEILVDFCQKFYWGRNRKNMEWVGAWEREEGSAGSEVVVGVVLLLKAIERLLEKTEFWPGLSRQAKIKEGGPRF